MTRHGLESMRRVAQLAARNANNDGAAELYAALLEAHRLGLPAWRALDADAAPLHHDGVWIVCDDVPAIPSLDTVDDTPQ